MSKTETAKRLATQTAKQRRSTETSPGQFQETDNEQVEKEMLNLFQATGKILETVMKIQRENQMQWERLDSLEKEHWKQVRMLIIFMMLPLSIGLIALLILLSR